MLELTPEQIRGLAATAGVSIGDDDLAEVTHRVNAFAEALGPLAELPLETVEPLPIAPDLDE
jgi:hypothetical protein